MASASPAVSSKSRAVFSKLIPARCSLRCSAWNAPAGWIPSGGYRDSRRAKFYALTRAGKKQLEIETADWTRLWASAIARLLREEA